MTIQRRRRPRGAHIANSAVNDDDAHELPTRRRFESGHFLPTMAPKGASVQTTEVLAVFTVVAILVVQFAMSRLEVALHQHRHMQKMVAIMYEQLTHVGLVAFVLYIIEVASGGISPAQRHSFETVHMTIFVVAIVHSLFVVLLVIMSLRISRQWEHTEAQDQTHWRELMREKAALAVKLHLVNETSTSAAPGSSPPPATTPQCCGKLRLALWRACCAWGAWRRYAHVLRMMRFHELKWRFLRFNQLPPHFHFTSYLRKAKQHVFTELAVVPPVLWAGLATALLLDLVLRDQLHAYSEAFGWAEATPAVCSVVIVGCASSLAKVRDIYWRIMHSQVIEVAGSEEGGADDDDAAAAVNVADGSVTGGGQWAAMDRELRRRASTTTTTVAKGDEVATLRTRWSHRSGETPIASDGGVVQPGLATSGNRLRSTAAAISDEAVRGIGAAADASVVQVARRRSSNILGTPSATVALHRELSWVENLTELGPSSATEPAVASQPRQAWCWASLAACCRSQRTGQRFHQRDLFWFRNPPFVVKLLRTMIFLASVVIATVLQFAPSQLGPFASSVRSAAVVGTSLVVMTLAMAVLLQRTVPLYVLSTHIAELVDERLLLVALRKSDNRHAIRIARRARRAMRRAGSTSTGLHVNQPPSDTQQHPMASGKAASPSNSHFDAKATGGLTSPASPAPIRVPSGDKSGGDMSAAGGATPGGIAALTRRSSRPPLAEPLLHKAVARVLAESGHAAPHPEQPGRPLSIRAPSVAQEAPLGRDRAVTATRRASDIVLSPLPVERAFWSGGGEWMPVQARNVIASQRVASSAAAAAAALSRDEWAALLAGLPEDQAAQLPRDAREALVDAFQMDLPSSSSSDDEEAHSPSPSASARRCCSRQRRQRAGLAPAGCTDWLVWVGDGAAFSESWHALVFLVIAVDAVAGVLQASDDVASDIGVGSRQVGSALTIAAGSILALEWCARVAASIVLVATGRAERLAAPAPVEEPAANPDASDVSSSAGWLIAWRVLDLAILAASAVVSLVVGITGNVPPVWSALAVLRLVFIAPWRRYLFGDSLSQDGHDHSEELAQRRRLHSHSHHRHRSPAPAVPATMAPTPVAVDAEAAPSPRPGTIGAARQLSLAGSEHASLREVLAARGELTFYDDKDRDYSHGVTAGQLQVAALARRIRQSSVGEAADLPHEDSPIETGTAPLSEIGAGELVGEDVLDVAAGEGNLAGALAAEINLVIAHRTRSSTVMVLSPVELATALADLRSSEGEHLVEADDPADEEDDEGQPMDREDAQLSDTDSDM